MGVRMVVPWWAQGIDLNIPEHSHQPNMEYTTNYRGTEGSHNESKDSSGSDIINSQGYLSLEDWTQNDNHQEVMKEEEKNVSDRNQENTFQRTLLCRRVLLEPRKHGKYVVS